MNSVSWSNFQVVIILALRGYRKKGKDSKKKNGRSTARGLRFSRWVFKPEG